LVRNKQEEVLHRLEDFRPPDWLTPEVSLLFLLSKSSTFVKADYLVVRSGANPGDSAFFNGVDLDFVAVRCNGVLLNRTQIEITNDGIWILETPSDSFRLSFENRISPSSNSALEGLYLSRSLLCTQNEPEGFRKITYSIDRPDNMMKFRVHLVASQDEFPVLLSNGNKMEQTKLPHGKISVVWEDPFPKPSYLFALVAGKLSCHEDFFQTQSGRFVRLQIFTENEPKSRSLFAMDALKKAFQWEESTFGLEYDLELYMIVAVSDFNTGAMENKGLNIFNSKLILADETITTDEGLESILGVVAHEYFHNYTGNRVTLRNWFQLTLKEGLTVFRDQWFTEDMTNPDVKRIQDVKFLREFQFAEDSGRLSHPILPKSYVEMNNFYTVTIYEKGSEVIRMLSVFFGKKGFRKGLELYLQKYDGMAVTVEEFLGAMEEANGISLASFRNWYHNQGTPLLQVQEKWNPEERTWEVTFRESRFGNLEFPIALALFSPQGKLLEEKIHHHTGETSQWSSWGHTEKPILSCLRGFSAPVRVHFPRPLTEWQVLALSEKDGFSRFEAREEILLKVFRDFLEKNEDNSHLLVELFERMLAPRENLGKDFQSLFLQFPAITQLAESLQIYDYLSLHTARTQIVKNLARMLEGNWRKIYLRENQNCAGIQNEEFGKRKLKNLALGYLLYLEDTREVESWALEQQKSARCMTDELAPLRMINELSLLSSKESLHLFFEKWESEVLVMDLWLHAQTLGSSDLVFFKVQALTEHPIFSWRNPNRVRALLGGFARNPLLLYRKDGAGLRFLQEAVRKLDRINPQSASSLAKQLQKLNHQSQDLQILGREILESLLVEPNLSRALGEVSHSILHSWV